MRPVTFVMRHRQQKSRDQKQIEKQKSRKAFDEEVDAINDRLNEIAKNNFIDPNLTDEFTSLPIMESTKTVLAANKFTKMSPIQKQSLLYSLCGRDLIGAAETGSGKTLAFLIPVIECLTKAKFSRHSGIGAIIISPTRDLAAQTFDVLKRLIKDSDLSAALITGGMDFELEQEGLTRMNILIATIGRLKEHMENSPQFDSNHVQILVLDEADKLLNKENMRDLKHVLADLPSTRQTLLFTATAAKAIKELTKLSLVNPARVLISEGSETATPANLQQFYTMVPLDQKWNTLFSFLKTHRSNKTIVFMETVKMVRFAFEAFCALRPGLPILHLTGKQNSTLRFKTCQDFARQDRCVIFTTDVAARGLDFPAVDWVVQLDCPATTDTYIHRVGRTARFHKEGKALLFLTPSEKAMVDRLEKAKVSLNAIQIAGDALEDVRPRLVDLVAKKSDIMHLAKKALETYVRSVQRRDDGEVFNFAAVQEGLEAFARSFGLLSVPIMKGKSDKKSAKESSEKVEEEVVEEEPWFHVVDSDDEGEDDTANTKAVKPTTLEFIDADTQIEQEDYNQWRQYLRDLLKGTEAPKAPRKQDRKKAEKAAEQEEEEEIDEEEAKKKEQQTIEDLLFGDL